MLRKSAASKEAPNNSFNPTPHRGVGRAYATLARVRYPASGQLNSCIRMLMKFSRLFPPFLLLAMLTACEFRSSAVDSAPAGSSVKILSISPEISSSLHVGEKVRLQVDVGYSLDAPSGTLSLVVQASDNSGVAQDMQVLTKGSGKAKFEADFVVPNTKAIQVFTPLSGQGQSSTSTVDMWAFKVVGK